MRNLIVAVVAMLATGCGASSAAKSVRYAGDKDQLFAAMKAAVAARYKLHDVDPATLTIKTDALWFAPDGTPAPARGDEGRGVADRSLQIVEVVSLLPSDDAWVIAIHPVYQRYSVGRANPDVVREDDTSIPAFARDRIDRLAADLHEALESYEVATVPAVAHPSAPPPPSATPEPPLGY